MSYGGQQHYGAPSGGPPGYGGAPPPQQGYGGAQGHGGYAPPPAHSAPPAHGGYGAPPPAHGAPAHGAPPAHDGYGAPPPAGGPGGYGGGFAPPPASGPPPGADPQLWSWFSSVDTDLSGAITAPELERALINGDWTPFDLDTVKLLMTIFDTDRSGTIGFNEVGGGFFSFLILRCVAVGAVACAPVIARAISILSGLAGGDIMAPQHILSPLAGACCLLAPALSLLLARALSLAWPSIRLCEAPTLCAVQPPCVRSAAIPPVGAQWRRCVPAPSLMCCSGTQQARTVCSVTCDNAGGGGPCLAAHARWPLPAQVRLGMCSVTQLRGLLLDGAPVYSPGQFGATVTVALTRPIHGSDALVRGAASRGDSSTHTPPNCYVVQHLDATCVCSVRGRCSSILYSVGRPSCRLAALVQYTPQPAQPLGAWWCSSVRESLLQLPPSRPVSSLRCLAAASSPPLPTSVPSLRSRPVPFLPSLRSLPPIPP
ncbi:hypothetical protein C8J57DRAFT_1598215 [Mycena rebaudengoi]|nr:hypothetical protein C8J57DRAFT_1598215 [Mycena rebaudengoi]